MSEGGLSPRELVMTSSPSYSLAKPQGRWARDSPGSTNTWVSLRPTSDARGPTEVLGSRSVPTPAGMKNLLDLLLIQNILTSSVLRESRSQPILTITPVSTDSKILKHFDQMRTLISGFLQQKSDRQTFFDYLASEAEKMIQEEFEDLKGRIFRDTEAVRNTTRRQVLPKRSATITKESQRVGILPTTTQQASSSTQAAAGSSSSSYVY